MRIAQDTAAGRRQFERNMEQRRLQETGQGWKGLRRGWYWGDEAFRQELLGQMTDRLGAEHYGQERAETAEAKAQRIVEQELKGLRWSAQDLECHRKGDGRKLRRSEEHTAELQSRP